jgi:hypothetical protein
LTARFEQAIDGSEIALILVVAEDGGTDNVIKALRRQVIKRIETETPDILKGLPARVSGKLGVEGGGRDGVFIPEHGGKMLCPEAGTRSDLKNRFSWENMKAGGGRSKLASAA